MKVVAVVKTGNLRDPDPARHAVIEVIDAPEDPVGDEEVKIKVAYCAICGSDPHMAEGIYFGAKPPIKLGHEISGVIVELGKKATLKGLKVGDKVSGNFWKPCGTCYYCLAGEEQFCENRWKLDISRRRPGMAEYLVWHESQVWKMPDDVKMEEACLLEPLSIAMRIVDQSKVKIGGKVVVSGGGPIGLLTLQLFKMYGATSLTLIEPIPERQQIAREFGADHIIDPLTEDVREAAMKYTDGHGYNIVVEASGNSRAAETAITIADRGATVLFIAMYNPDYRMPFDLFENCYHNELRVTGIFNTAYIFPRTVQMFPRVNFKPFTQMILPMERCKEAFDIHMTGKYPKVILICNDF
jgi:(R,R)-butanediol dehydrogenase/meso-butanediol dehydrogenase/diacetyl reductase/L-iditol 2-dehydrogenase